MNFLELFQNMVKMHKLRLVDCIFSFLMMMIKNQMHCSTHDLAVVWASTAIMHAKALLPHLLL
ncbi:hypothetical protein T10_9914 [Trichinella papuae]|uniref:Uncharacterized protein n=1 Tax=Trichinella papuae TaxID=268474 RepID=A0A0V1N6N8_9BILA|nr:hypothetical protein T10_9914 [Trichinella papuae]